jgi:hypothetical protein
VRNHRNPLAKFEVMHNGSWVTLPRQEWNYFLASNGLGTGPFTFRVTDIFGNQIVSQGVPLLNNATYPGNAQFPRCLATRRASPTAAPLSTAAPQLHPDQLPLPPPPRAPLNVSWPPCDCIHRHPRADPRSRDGTSGQISPLLLDSVRHR